MPDLLLNEYQERAVKTAIYGEVQVLYPAIGVVNEAGELIGKVKKWLRGDRNLADTKPMLLDEAGDVLWYLAALCRDLGTDLGTVAHANLKKLADRHERGVIKGDGDKR